MDNPGFKPARTYLAEDSPAGAQDNRYPKNGSSNNSTDNKNKPLRFIKKIINSLKAFWSRLSKRQKIPFVFAGFSALLLFVSLLLSGKVVDKVNIFERKSDINLDLVGDWVRLKIPQRESPFFSLSPTTQSKYGILPQESFTLQAKEPINEKFVIESIESSIPVKISSISKQIFIITPQTPLGLDEVINIKLAVATKESSNHTFDRDYSWAYQTQGKFRVVSTIPGDKKTNVPVNTGIEIIFSQDDYKDPSLYINIKPAISYKTERHGETLAIVPLQPLTPKTVYTVTLNKGLNLESRNDPINENLVFSFQTTEPATKPARLNVYEDFYQVSTKEPLVAKVFTSNWSSDEKINTEIYKFPSLQDYINSRKNIDDIQSSWMMYYEEEGKVSTENLPRVAQVELTVHSKENTQYIQLPDSLTAGYYLVQLWFNDGKEFEQIWLQSTDLTGYTSAGKEETVVWVNNVDGGPVNNAQITIAGTNSQYTTNDRGSVVFPSPQILFDKGRHYVQITSQDNKQLALPIDSLSGNTKPGQQTSNDYWSYLYHERRLYKPGDTIYYWGVIKNRNNNSAPSSAKIVLSKGQYSDNTFSISENITPQPDGSFIGNFSLTDVPSGWYYLSINVNDLSITSSGFQIKDFEKPEMKIEVSAEKKAVFTGETVEFTAHVRFFDETPAANIPIKVYEARTGKSEEIESDSNGEVKYLYQPKYSSPLYYPRYEGVTFNPALAQQVKVEGHGSVYVYGSKLMIKTETNQEGSKASLKAFVNHVDLSGVNSGNTSDAKGKPVQNQSVKLHIVKTWWEKKEEGTYYDFIEKVTRPSYKYTKRTEVITDKDIITNSQGEVFHEFELEVGKSYQAELTATDTDGHPATKKDYFYYFQGNESFRSQKAYPQLSLNKEDNAYSVGENVDLSILLGNEKYPDSDKNRFLFIVANRGKQETLVQDEPKLNFAFENKHIPNIYVAAIVFTGRYYEKVTSYCRWEWRCSNYYSYYQRHYFNGLEIRYKKEDSELNLEIKTDRDTYKPGDNAEVSVQVTKNQNPLPNTQVNVVLVDQALAALGGIIKPSILSTLYKSTPSFIYYNYSSHEPVFPDESAAEMGGGGGGDREIFKDAAYFGQAKTDENGNVSFNFKLPDNITTWIIYAQGLTENLNAGQSEGSLISSKEFFVTSQFPKEYLVKDEPFIAGNSFGSSLNKDVRIDYEALFFQGETEKDKKQGSANSFSDIHFPFPQLNVGDYKVSMRGKYSGKEDGISLPFKVIESRFDFQNYTKSRLNKGEQITSLSTSDYLSDKPITLVVSDLGKGIYYNSLAQFCYTGSNRLEKQLAKVAAGKILDDRFDDDRCSTETQELIKFQYFDGGLSQVKWGGSNLKTTTWATFIDPKPFNKSELLKYFEGQSNDGRAGSVQKIYTAWGLTNLGTPKINDLHWYADTATTYEEKIISALALASAGEKEKALDLYYNILADYAYTYKPYIRIQATPENSDLDQYIKDTSHSLLLGSMVNKEYNEGFYQYLRDYRTRAEDIVIDLSDLAFIRDELNKLPDEDTGFYFKSAVRELSEILKGGRSKAITLSGPEANDFTLKVTQGKAEARVNYFIGSEGFSKLQPDDRLTLKRTYRKVKGDGDKIYPGDIVEVRIDFYLDMDKAPLGSYTVTDFLPSGLRWLSNPSAYGLSTDGWVRETGNNILTYTFYNSPWWQVRGRKYIVYFARANAVGTYIAEPTVLQSRLDFSVFQKVDEDKIVIDSKSP